MSHTLNTCTFRWSVSNLSQCDAAASLSHSFFSILYGLKKNKKEIIYVTLFVAFVESPLAQMFEILCASKECSYIRFVLFRFLLSPLILLSVSDLLPVKIETKDRFNSYTFWNAWTVLKSLIACVYLLVVRACVHACAVDILLHQLLFVSFDQWQGVTHHTKQI